MTFDSAQLLAIRKPPTWPFKVRLLFALALIVPPLALFGPSPHPVLQALADGVCLWALFLLFLMRKKPPTPNYAELR